MLAAAFIAGALAVTGAPPAAPPPRVIQCTQRRDPPKTWPYGNWRPHAIRAGPLALVGARDLEAFQPEPPAGPFIAEIPILLRHDRQVTLAVPPPHELWTDHGTFDGPVTFAACSPWQRRFDSGRVGRWTHFGAGIAAATPGCVALSIWPDGAPKPMIRHLAVGVPRRSCSGP